MKRAFLLQNAAVAAMVMANPHLGAAKSAPSGLQHQQRQLMPTWQQVAQIQQMANYEAPILQGTVATTYKSSALVYSSGSRRIMAYEIEFGQSGALSSTDCQCQWDVSRFSSTNILTATSVVPNPLDPADGTCLALFLNNATTELTYTTAGVGLSLKNWGINQRGSYRWRALDDGDNLIIPATNLVGLGIRTLSSNFTGSAVGNLSFVER
jgi:hypothetical protein